MPSQVCIFRTTCDAIPSSTLPSVAVQPFFADLRRFVNQPATPHYLTCTEEAREAVSAEYQIVIQLRVHLEVHP